MFGTQRKLDNEDELYDIAVRALMRRAHSVSEMQKVLERRADSELLVKVVLAKLREKGQLDDARYAKQFVRQRTEIRRQGKFRITGDLRARGVADEHISAALAEAAEQVDETALVRQRIERKLKLTRGEVDERKVASLYRSLLRDDIIFQAADRARRRCPRGPAGRRLAERHSPCRGRAHLARPRRVGSGRGGV